MTTMGLCILLLSAFIHATWNYLSKKANGGVPFIWLFTAIATVFYTPLAIGIILYQRPHIGLIQIVFIIASIIAHLGFFLVLQKGYKIGDLSFVYPIARGTGPLITCILAVVIFNEKPTVFTFIGTFLILISILFFTGGIDKLKQTNSLAPVLYSLAVGVIIAGYTLLDKGAVSNFLIPPLLLDFCNTVGRLIILTPFAVKNWGEVTFEWKHHRREAAGVGVFNSLAYILALSVMVFAPVSHVAPIREISILIGTIMGSVLLSEGFGKLRVIAATFMVLGVISVAIG
ncbi:DMT family transporter [Bacillus atrophaeus]|uniref:DMT family transporter n=1 Tax=Bacillus atrophaeus TaxID=1452 RepID=UPI00227E02CA|nr:DMT family transporter [Bacillus atrophaeus]MCY8836665.1 DMT family transporter [Bacillus atrophaeus]